MSRLTDNRKYLRGLVAQFISVPAEAAAEIAVRIYAGMVEHTAFDSGQAAANWHLQPYVGSVSFQEQQIMWGYGAVSPVAPVGYKWSGGVAEDQVKSGLVMQQMEIASDLRGRVFDGISVYNPIQPGYSGFAPGNDERYFEYALGEAEARVGEVVQKAVAEGLAAIALRHPYLRIS